jgi:uncharacterized membrane protein
VFVALGAAILVVGALVVGIAVRPGLFGLRTSSVVPFAGGFFGIFLILWGAVILARAVAGPRGRRRFRGPQGRFDPAVALARQRFARGEITREQFHEIVSELRRPPPGSLP